MGNASNQTQRQFGKRKDVHRIIIAKGDKMTAYRVNPLLAGFAVCCTVLLGVGYLGATGYLMFRDDILNTSIVKQAQIEQSYEDKIARLNAKIESLVSHNMVEKQAVDMKLRTLIDAQRAVVARDKMVLKLASDASSLGLATVVPPVPMPHPMRMNEEFGIDPIVTGSTSNSLRASYQDEGNTSANQLPFKHVSPDLALQPMPAMPQTTDLSFDEAEMSLRKRKKDQMTALHVLTKKASTKANRVSTILSKLGYKIAAPTTDVGGPYVDIESMSDETFNTYVNAYEQNAAHLNKLLATAKKLPAGNPSPQGRQSSKFGVRKDPFTGRRAMHSGLDYSARSGSPVLSTGPGVVIHAKTKGGYGKMIEVRHKDGITTRYAHLSKIKVRKGQHVDAGELIGNVGSTGRSTGPHLHYEVRVDGKAVNPVPFLQAGKRLAGL